MGSLRNSLTEHRRYLAQESALILLLGYAVLAGGTFNGLVLARVRLVNTVLLALVGAIWLAWRLLRREPFPRTSLDLPLLGYLVAVAISAAFSIDPRRSAGAVWRLGLYVLLFYLFVDLLRHGWPAELFVKVLLIIGAIVLVFGLWYVARWMLSWHAIWGWARPIPTITVRIRSLIGHANWLAAFVNLLWPLAVFRLIRATRWGPRVVLLIWVIAAAITIYLTSSRGGWLGTMAGIGMVAVLSLDPARARRWLFARRWRVVLGGAAALAAALALAVLANRQLSHPSHGSVLASRLHFWRTAWSAFRASPVLGTGPFTYGETYLATHSVPPDALYGVAHSYPINLAAESGLVGLAALAWVALALGRSLWRGWRRWFGEDGSVQLGALAAVSTCVVHSQFDSVVALPYVAVLLALLLAILLKDGAREHCRLTRPGAGAWVLPLGWALLLLSSVWSLRASLVFSKGCLAANTGDWSAAARWLGQAVQRDPHMAVYQLQAGYADGMRGEEDASALPEAIERYRAAIPRSPNYALNAANLSALHWKVGRFDGALKWMERAVQQAPRSALLHLNLGRLYEELGRVQPAQDQYQQALSQAPGWSQAFFWRATPLRASVREAWVAGRPGSSAVEAPSTPGQWYAVGTLAVADGRHDEACHAFQRAVAMDPHYTPAYVGQAAACCALGREDEAEQLLRTALITEGGAELDRVRARFALARLYHRQGKAEKALALAEQALRLARDPPTHLPGGLGSADYAWYLFHAETIQSSLLPQLTVITVTDEVAGWMLELGDWYREGGDTDAAARVYGELLDEVPDSAAARERLAGLLVKPED